MNYPDIFIKNLLLKPFLQTITISVFVSAGLGCGGPKIKSKRAYTKPIVKDAPKPKNDPYTDLEVSEDEQTTPDFTSSEKLNGFWSFQGIHYKGGFHLKGSKIEDTGVEVPDETIVLHFKNGKILRYQSGYGQAEHYLNYKIDMYLVGFLMVLNILHLCFYLLRVHYSCLMDRHVFGLKLQIHIYNGCCNLIALL